MTINPMALAQGLPLKSYDNGDGTSTLYVTLMTINTNPTLTGRGVIHNAGTTTIYPNPTFVELGGNGFGAIPTDTKILTISSTIGYPLVVSVATSAPAASASQNQIMLVPGAGPLTIDYVSSAGDTLYVATGTSATATSNYLTVNYQG